MKKMFFLFIVLVGTSFSVTGQASEKKLITSQITVDDLFPKVSLETILKVIKDAQIENGIKDINIVYRGQIVRYKYPNGGGYFSHMFARGEYQILIVRKYLTIPNYEDIDNPRKPTYWSRK